jgi:hypothetical protein
MNRLYKLQFLGPLTLFVATLSAELAARALAHAPASETFWYLNLRVFSLFQRSHTALREYVNVDGFQLFGIALPIFALACIGLMVRSRLPLALSTQLAVGYAALLVKSSQTQLVAQASLTGFALPVSEGFYILTAILGACLVSCLITHWIYLRTSQINRTPDALPA